MKKRVIFTIPICLLLIAFIVISFFLMSMKPTTSKLTQGQKLEEYTRPAVVRILDYAVVQWQYNGLNTDINAFLKQSNYQTLIGESGSGAIISSDGYIVTNAHVVEISKTEKGDIATEAMKQLAKQIADTYKYDYNSVLTYLAKSNPYTEVKTVTKVLLPGGDILDAEIKSYGAPINPGKDVAVLKIEGKNFPTLPLGNSDTIQNQDDIWVSGYPAAADSDLLSPASTFVSTTNEGQINTISKSTKQGNPVIQLNAAATHGNSGGPVLNKKGEIIGLLTFRGDTVNGQEVQGFNFAVPVNTVKEFVNQAGANSRKSDTDILYKEGLTLYWGGYYKNALDKFETVQRIFPNHSEIKQYISNAERRVGDSKILWSDYPTSFYIVDGISGILIIFLLLFTFALRPKHPPLAAAANSSPVPDPALASTLTGSPEKILAELDKDGKIDIQEILKALQELQKNQKKEDE